MISGEKIGKYIASPELVEASDLVDLAELIKKYPYCSSFQLLHLKGLAVTNNLDFERHLKSTAIHSPDRTHLYELIHSGNTQELKETEEQAIEEVITETVTKEVEVSESADELIEMNSITEIERPISEREIDDVSPISTEPDTGIEKEVPNEVEEESATTEADELDEIEVNILNQAIDITLVNNGVANLPEIEKETPIEKTKVIETDKKEEIAVKETTEELSFTAWLRQKQTKKDSDNSILQLQKEDGIETTKNESSTSVDPAANTKKEKSKTDIDRLLDKFMEEEPRISKPIKDFYNPVKNAKESVVESADLVSETLAKIHVMQKNYSKAITAYEQLILLYPEKKTFFASQIEKIRAELKNN